MTISQVREDIKRQLDMRDPRVLLESFNRPNIRLTVRYKVLILFYCLRWGRGVEDLHGSRQRIVTERQVGVKHGFFDILEIWDFSTN